MMNFKRYKSSNQETMPSALVEIKTELETTMESNEHALTNIPDLEKEVNNVEVDLNIVKKETATENVCSEQRDEIKDENNILSKLYESECSKPCQELTMSQSITNSTSDLGNFPRKQRRRGQKRKRFRRSKNWILRHKERTWEEIKNSTVEPITDSKYVLTIKNWPTNWSFPSIIDFIDQEYDIVNKIEMAVDNEDCFAGMIRLGFDSLSHIKRAIKCLDGKVVSGNKLQAVINDSLEEPGTSKENPDCSVESEDESKKNPDDTIENPNHSMENPGQTIENPDHTKKYPDNSMENPENTARNPEDTVEKYNNSEDSGDESGSDSDSSEPQAKRWRLTEEPWRPDIDVWEKDPAGLYGLKREFLKSLGITPPIDEWVHVTNFRCDKSELIEVMELAGEVITCTIVARKQTYAKVRFSHPLEAVQAISMLNNKSFYGQPLKVLMDQCPSDRVILPKGLESVGPGLGETGTPLRDIVRQYERYVKGRSSSVNTNIFSNPDEKLFSFDVHEADISDKASKIVDNPVSKENRTRYDSNNSDFNNEISVPPGSSTSIKTANQPSHSLKTQISNELASENWSRPQDPIAGPDGNWSTAANSRMTVQSNIGTLPGNSGSMFGNSGSRPVNNAPIQGSFGVMHGNTGPMQSNTGSMPVNTSPYYSGPKTCNTAPMSGNTGPISYNTGHMSNIGTNEYSGMMANGNNTRNMSGFAGSVPHTRTMTSNTGQGSGYTGYMSGPNCPKTANTGSMHGYSGPVTGNTGPVQGQRNILGNTGLMSGNSVSMHGYTGNMPGRTMPNNTGNFNNNLGITSGHIGPNFGNTGPMPRPQSMLHNSGPIQGPNGPNFGNNTPTHGLRMPTPNPNRSYTGGPNGPHASLSGGHSRPKLCESPTDSYRTESPTTRPVTQSSKQQMEEDYITLEISNLPLSTSFPVLCEKMSECGQVMSLQLTGPGCAIVQYATRSQAERCFQTYNKFRVLDNIIDVRFL